MEKILKLAEGNQEEALKMEELEKKRIQEEQNKKQQETQKLEEIERQKKEQKEAALRWLDEEEDKRQKVEEEKRMKLVNKFGVQNMWAPDAKSPIVTGTVTQGNVPKKVGKNDKKTTKTETTTAVPELYSVFVLYLLKEYTCSLSRLKRRQRRWFQGYQQWTIKKMKMNGNRYQVMLPPKRSLMLFQMLPIFQDSQPKLQ